MENAEACLGWEAQLVALVTRGLSCTPKWLQVRFLVRVHAWVVGLIPGWDMFERQPIDVFLTLMSLSLSLSLFLSLSPSLSL